MSLKTTPPITPQALAGLTNVDRSAGPKESHRAEVHSTPPALERLERPLQNAAAVSFKTEGPKFGVNRTGQRCAVAEAEVLPTLAFSERAFQIAMFGFGVVVNGAEGAAVKVTTLDEVSDRLRKLKETQVLPKEKLKELDSSYADQAVLDIRAHDYKTQMVYVAKTCTGLFFGPGIIVAVLGAPLADLAMAMIPAYVLTLGIMSFYAKQPRLYFARHRENNVPSVSRDSEFFQVLIDGEVEFLEQRRQEEIGVLEKVERAVLNTFRNDEFLALPEIQEIIISGEK